MTTSLLPTAHLSEIALPDFGMPAVEPTLPPSIYIERLERLRAAMERERIRACRRVGRSGAQRQHRLPHRVRSTIRGGRADRRHVRRPGAAARQRVLRRRRRRTAAGSAGAVPGPQPSGSVTGPVAAVARDHRRRRHRAGKPRRCHRVEDVRESGDDRRAGVPDRRTPTGHWRVAGSSRTQPTSSSTLPTDSGSSTRSSSSPRSSGPPARRRTACGTCSWVSNPG